MPVTRSSTRSANNSATATPLVTEKRKYDSDLSSKSSQKRPRVVKSVPATQLAESSLANVTIVNPKLPTKELALVPAVLTFSFEDAKQHLIRVDHRFEDLFNKMPCKPYEQLEQVHPFRSLVTSIIGQQISWLAARSVNYKFVRLYDPSLPEKPDDYESQKSPTSFFPSPEQVAGTDPAVLRTAGLSGRKAEYVQDLASRFADGRLSTEKLVSANDEELAQMLIEVKGIGRWTVDMFAIFSLRRPDILPVGDLGVQRGLVRWFLSLHSPDHGYSLSPLKVAAKESSKKKSEGKVAPSAAPISKDELPVFQGSSDGITSGEDPTEATTPNISSAPLTMTPSNSGFTGNGIPPSFTPSIKETLKKSGVEPGSSPVPLPDGLTIAILRSRLDGKKVKGAFLTPKEMEELTECWKPYRSLGVFYMWSLAKVSE